MDNIQLPFRSFPFFAPVVVASVLAGLLCLGCTKTESNLACPSDSTQILLTSPKGGEVFKIGDTLRVKWTLCNAGSTEINAVDPFLSPDDGKTWCYLKISSIFPGDADFGNYALKIPDSIGLQGQWFQLKNNPHCRIKVEQYSTLDDKQRSISGDFTIE